MAVMFSGESITAIASFTFPLAIRNIRIFTYTFNTGVGRRAFILLVLASGTFLPVGSHICLLAIRFEHRLIGIRFHIWICGSEAT